MRNRSSIRPRLRPAVCVLVALALMVTAPPVVADAAGSGLARPVAPVDRQVLTELATDGHTTFLVHLRQRADLTGPARLRDSTARATEVYRQLTGTARRSQRELRAELDRRKATYQAFWIANVLRVTGDRALLDSLAARPEVARIAPSRTYRLDPLDRVGRTGRARTAAVEWGLTNIGAPRVWAGYGVRGEGVVVANIDTGVQYDHPALVGAYRGNTGAGTFDHSYNWFDPTGVCPSPTPCDNNGHGTHTMGTMVGDDGTGNQIGVAPGATWIAAKGCETSGCSDASLLAAGQWVLAPTDSDGQNPRPDRHADIVNNSWSGGGGDLWYADTVAAWRAAGIFPTFAAGNAGPACGTAGSPGDNPGAYAVGSYDVGNAISDFSARGASGVDGSVKPNIAAPGEAVRSSVPGGGYDAFSGTSMASPHVSGTVALVWSAAPGVKGAVAATEALLDRSATNVDATGCGGTAEDNNTFGEGRLNAYAAVTAAPRDSTGQVTGTVTDAADGDPVAGATVRAGDRETVTGADGRYALTVPAGEVEVTVSAYGFTGQRATVTVPAGQTVTRDFALTAAPLVTVSGRVTDGSGHGWPLYARIEVAGRPGGPVHTSPGTGRFSLRLPGNATYRLRTSVRYPGYRTVTTEVPVGTTARTVNLRVPVEATCTAPGYTARLGAPLLRESFDATTTPAGWSVRERTPGGGWGFTDLGRRGNLTGGAGGFATVDSDALGEGNHQDTDLVTPPLDLSGAPAPLLRFHSDWRAVGGGDTADIDISTDGGTTWVGVWHQTDSRRGPTVEEVPLTPAAGAAAALVRFRFTGSFAWWWQVDDVEVVNRACAPVPGGLVLGFTTDRNTRRPLNDVLVSSVDAPTDTGRSAPTPDDPGVPDGFYWLFSRLTGTHPFTATKSPYQPTTKTVDVRANRIRWASFALR